MTAWPLPSFTHRSRNDRLSSRQPGEALSKHPPAISATNYLLLRQLTWSIRVTSVSICRMRDTLMSDFCISGVNHCSVYPKSSFYLCEKIFNVPTKYFKSPSLIKKLYIRIRPIFLCPFNAFANPTNTDMCWTSLAVMKWLISWL